MRVALWRKAREKAQAVMAVAIPAPVPAKQARTSENGDIDLRALGDAIKRNRRWIIVPTVAALVLSLLTVNMITARYKSEARILIDGRENVFLRPNSERNEERAAPLDPEAVTSQVQLVLSRDLARDIIRKNRLAELPEFDVVLHGISPLKSLAAMAGLVRDPLSMSPE